MAQSSEGNVYQRLGEKIDGLPFRTPWNETFHSILKELYTSEEAEIVVKMPYTLSALDRIAKITKIEKTQLRNILEKLCNDGLVIDVWNEKDNQYYYMPWPFVPGIFEFTMMRKGDNLNTKEWAKLFHEYFDPLYTTNYSHKEQISAFRVIPIEETITPDKYIKFLDFENATSIIDNSRKLAIGLCSCRNEKYNIGKKECDAPLESCSFMGLGADYTIRNNLAREVSKSEMLDHFARAKELGLVFCSYNTGKRQAAICQCCKCCCNYLAGITRFGYTNSVITSNYISKINTEVCKGCGKCLEVCPVNAVSLISANDPKNKKRKTSIVNKEICIGCGVCALKCPTHSIDLIARDSKVIPPESIFEFTMLSSLERGTLQNQLFDNPESITHNFMRAFIGGFLRLSPVKKALMSDLFRSSFLNFMTMGAKLQGKGWMTEL